MKEDLRPHISVSDQHLMGQKLEQLFNALEDFLIILDREGRIIKVNQAILIAAGYSEEEVLGTFIEGYFPPKEIVSIRRHVSQALKGKRGTFRSRVRKSNGTYLRVEVRLTKAFWNNDKALIGLARDISPDERVRAELSRSRNQQKALLDNIPYQAWLKDNNGVFLAVNEAFASYYGSTPEKLIGKTYFDICQGEAAQSFVERDNEVARTKKQLSHIEQRDVDGRTKWFESYNTPILAEGGEVIGTTGIARDITEQRIREEQLLQSLKQQELLSEVAYTLNLNIGFDKKINRVMRNVGESLELSRIYIFEDVKGGEAATNTFEWCAPGIPPQKDELTEVPYAAIPSWKPHLERHGLIKSSDIHELPEDMVRLLEPQEIKAILVYPILINNFFSGFIGFDECARPRVWERGEADLLQTISHLIANTYTRHKAAEGLQRSERKFRELVEMLPEMVSEADADGAIIFANNLALKKFGYTREDVAARKVNVLDLFADSDRERAAQVFQKIIRKEKMQSADFEYNARTASNEEFPVLCYVNLIEERGTFKGLRGVMVDISDRKAQELRLKEAKEKAEEAAIAKQQFLATMSHEIRTPLNAIVGTVNLLTDSQLTPDQEDLLRTLEFSSNNLLALINDILDFSKIEAGKITLQEVEFHLPTMLRGIRSMFETRVAEKNLDIRLEMAPDLPEAIIGDPDRLSQVLNNLVSNAVKFTEEGSVIITADVQPDPNQSDKGLLKISVMDTGIGIPADKLDKIYDSFSQVHDFLTRKHEGTGLGLSITKRLIDIQGGTIDVESVVGKGSSFVVKLPIGIAANGTVEATNVEGSEAVDSLHGIHVLLVEDNLINQKIAGRFLQKWNAKVTTAANGQEAVDLVLEHTFDLILMDLQMPVMDGYEASRRIRNLDDKAKAKIPIIALTASALMEVQTQVFGAGMNDFITKPFNPKGLFQKISQAATADQ